MMAKAAFKKEERRVIPESAATGVEKSRPFPRDGEGPSNLSQRLQAAGRLAAWNVSRWHQSGGNDPGGLRNKIVTGTSRSVQTIRGA